MTVEFVDTNILYAHDRRDSRRHSTARQLIVRLTEAGNGALSIQVLQEWVNIVTRRVAVPLTAVEATEVVRDLDEAGWLVMSPKVADVTAALDAMERWPLSWWDALIVTAAQGSGATVLWTEDLNDGQKFEHVTVRNPFVSDRA